MKKLGIFVLASLVGAITSIGVYKFFDKEKTSVSYSATAPVQFANFNPSPSGQPVDFTFAAGISTPAVVHVKTIYAAKSVRVNPFFIPDPLREFFGDPHYYQNTQESIQFGSGVIITENGYIVTNNHVVSDGDDVEVTLMDKKNYKAEVVATDASTDLALLKIDAKNLPFIPFGNSDSVKIGEWVLAVGNPFNLTSTVTAGIVSAKARRIDIIQTQDQSGIESFIQTDAAVNRGNSGGALVNIRGELIGINTAIETPTGSFAGYAFAIPANIVKKVVDDMLKFGTVQRGYLGIQFSEITSEKAKELGFSNGVYVEKVNENSGAEDAGIKKGDVVIKINDIAVKNGAELQGQITQFRPGNKIKITVLRDGAEKEFFVTLKNKENNTDIVQKEKSEPFEQLGVELQDLKKSELDKLGIKNGVKISKIKDGKIKKETSMREGFVVIAIDNKKITSVEEAKKILQNKKGGVLIEGVYPNIEGNVYYGLGL